MQMRGQKCQHRLNYQGIMLVGAEGFEPPALCSQSRSDSIEKPIEIARK